VKQLELFDSRTLDRPRVDNITVPYEWERVDYLLSLPCPDFGPVGLSWEMNRNDKRSDPGYEDLKDDLAEQGFLDPIYVYLPHTRFDKSNRTENMGNGHHRLVAALDLGWTYVPVTRNPDHQWRDSGISAQ
jgi:hypothetical protein